MFGVSSRTMVMVNIETFVPVQGPYSYERVVLSQDLHFGPLYLGVVFVSKYDGNV